MTTFKVNAVDKAKGPLPPVKDTSEFLTEKLQAKPESYFKFPGHLNHVPNYSKNALIETVNTAFAQHYPLVLSPDIIWQCVAQGFAIHVNKNAEKLRHMFVAHDGKKTISVRRDDFVKGSPDNPWEETFDAFSDGIRTNVGDEIHSLLTPDFSTTGPVERAASQVVLMNTFKEYFDYEVMTSCGIPSITLEGTVEDWKKLREKTLSLSRFDFQWWTDAVKPILDEFVKASSGSVTKKFWQKIYKEVHGSGGPFITGWLVTLFPYLGSSPSNMRPNSFLTKERWDKEGMFYGVTSTSFPPGSVSTPFKWLYFNDEFEMNFYAGFLGMGQDKTTLALKPIIGWAVVDKEEEEKGKMKRRFLF